METLFQDVVRELRASGATVLLSSHVLAEAEALCDAVSIIRRGRVVEAGTLDQLRILTRTTVHVTTGDPLGDLASVRGVHAAQVAEAGRSAHFEVEAENLADVVAHLGGCRVLTLTSSPPTLEELFLRHYGDELATSVEPGAGGGAGIDGAAGRHRHRSAGMAARR
jgi:ABC-2 type transport system ATP-binding protein